MKNAVAVVLVLFAVALSASGEDLVRVVRVDDSDDSPSFRCGERCKFKAAVPDAPVRLRVFRGTSAQLGRFGNDPRVATGGCVEYNSQIIRPRYPRRPANVIDLRFYFRNTWLRAKGTQDGQFVFVVELDDRPNGPVVENPPPLRLPASLTDDYFEAGVDVRVRAPIYARTMNAAPPPPPPSLAYTTSATTTTASDAPVLLPTRSTPGNPQGDTARNDCVDIQFTGNPVVIQRADAGPRKDRRVAP